MDTAPCPCCDGEGMPLAALGARIHLRCRACGMQWSFIDDNDDDETNEETTPPDRLS